MIFSREQQKAMFASLNGNNGLKLKSKDLPPSHTTGLPKSGSGIYVHKLVNHAKTIKSIHNEHKALKRAEKEGERKQQVIDKAEVERLKKEADKAIDEANKIAMGDKHAESSRNELIKSNVAKGALPKEITDKIKEDLKKEEEKQELKRVEDDKNKIPISRGLDREIKNEVKKEVKQESLNEEPIVESIDTSSRGSSEDVPLLYATHI